MSKGKGRARRPPRAQVCVAGSFRRRRRPPGRPGGGRDAKVFEVGGRRGPSPVRFQPAREPGPG
eukprot:2125534-Lingulodinium_polyedra.AAC.1